MAGISILKNLLLKQAVKESGQASGIMSIGDSVRKLAEKRLQSYLVSAANKGIDLDKFSEAQIKYMLEMNQPYNRAKMALRKEQGIKSADVLDMKGQKLDPNKPIMGGTQSEEDILQKSIKKNIDEATEKGDFRGIANQVLRDPDIAKAFKEAINISGLVLSRADGDARGGAAISMRHITQCPIKFLLLLIMLSELTKYSVLFALLIMPCNSAPKFSIS